MKKIELLRSALITALGWRLKVFTLLKNYAIAKDTGSKESEQQAYVELCRESGLTDYFEGGNQ